MKEASSVAQTSRALAVRRSTILDSEVDDFETEREIASLLKYKSCSALQRQRQRGVGPPYIKLPTGGVRYRRSEVLAWLQSRRVDPSRA